ncbi:MAG: hypothetical protein ACOC2H_06690 [Spirochaetota bacterium]
MVLIFVQFNCLWLSVPAAFSRAVCFLLRSALSMQHLSDKKYEKPYQVNQDKEQEEEKDEA